MKKNRLGKTLCFLSLSAAIALGCGTDRRTEVEPDAGITLPADAGMTVDTTGPSCAYPEGPFGARVGAKLEPFSLNQCDGTNYDFFNEEFCEAKLTVISIAAGWCPPCIVESRQLTDTITEPYRERGVRVIQVLVQDEGYGAPDQAFCQGWVDNFGLTNIELLDPTQITSIYFPGDSLPSTIIVDENGIIQFRENGASEGLVTLRAKLDQLLED